MINEAVAVSNKNKRAQEKVIEEKMEEILDWYTFYSGGKAPEHVAEDKKSYQGIVRRWLEPLLPGLENPCLVEMVLGDSWTLAIEPIVPKIQVQVLE